MPWRQKQSSWPKFFVDVAKVTALNLRTENFAFSHFYCQTSRDLERFPWPLSNLIDDQESIEYLQTQFYRTLWLLQLPY